MRLSKSHTMALKKYGECTDGTYTEGWNPNSFFPKGVKLDIIQRHKHWVSKERVSLIDSWGDVVTDQNDNPIMIWKNNWKYDDDTTITKEVKLEEFYYPKEHKLLKKDQYLIVDDKRQRYRRDWSRLDNIDVERLLKKVGIVGWRIPINIEFSLDMKTY